MKTDNYQLAATLPRLKEAGRLVVTLEGRTLALFLHDGQVYAVDNRCPHMGFPLHRGTLKDGILTCHWHHARFDLASGGTFDLWADELPSFPVDIRGEEIWVDLMPLHDPRRNHSQRLEDGLERDLPLVIAKSVIALLEEGLPIAMPLRIGLQFGARYRRNGWGQGLTVLTCMANLAPHLNSLDQRRALYHGLSAVARDASGEPPRFMADPLPSAPADLDTLKRWFRRFVEVRDPDGAERCLLSAIYGGAEPAQVAEMLFAAATDHRYIDAGHPLDFTNKAFEALDTVGWEGAGVVLSSLVPGYTNAVRMEETNAWRHPIDLVAILENAFEKLTGSLEAGKAREGGWAGEGELSSVLLGDDPGSVADALLAALREGCAPVDLAGLVAYAAALRIARFRTSNEFSDWDTGLHTFTFANAVHQGLVRTSAVPAPDGYPPLLRGVFDAAMSVYLDRFLNIPPVPLPDPVSTPRAPAEILNELTQLLDSQQQVDQAGDLVAAYLAGEHDPKPLLAALGGLLLREDRNFHTMQAVEAAFRQFQGHNGRPTAAHILVAAARYLAAHAPTNRAQGQTFQIAYRLSRGENLYELEGDNQTE